MKHESVTGGAAPPRPHSLSAQLALLIASAIAVGLADAALVAGGVAGARGAFQYVPARIWVVAPLVWVGIATVAAVVVLPLSRRWGGLCGVALLGVLFLTIRLRAHPLLLAVALVAGCVFLAIAARWMARRTMEPRRSVAGVLLLVLAAAAVWGFSVPAVAAARAANPGSSAPNVIVIFLDTVRYDGIFDANGRVHADLKTLSRLAGEGTTFTRAYAPSPWTLPSHLSAMTGLAAHELGVSFDWQVYGRPDATLAERFRRRGYRTAAVISNSFLNAGSGFARGFDVFQHAEAALDVCRTAPGLMAETYWSWFSAAVCNWTASEVTTRARVLMDDERGPVFLTLNYMDAHDPYFVERSCGEASGYREAIRCIDRHLAPIVDWRSPRRPTVLAVVGDHGEQFGEHGLVRHGNSLYVQLLRVPLIVRPPSGDGARQRHEPISIAALPSLLEDVNTSVPHKRPVLALLHPPDASNQTSEWSALDGNWHLIVRERGTDALYDLRNDPAEEHNLIATNPQDPAIDRLRSAIDRMRSAPKPDLRRFRSLGYIH